MLWDEELSTSALLGASADLLHGELVQHQSVHRVYDRQEAYFISLICRLPREVVESLSLQMFKSLLHTVLGNLF